LAILAVNCCTRACRRARSTAKPASRKARVFHSDSSRCRRQVCNCLAASRRSSSSNQNFTQACRYSVGRYSLCGVSQATSTSASLALNKGVPPPPQKPTSTPALASSRMAAWVMEVPVPSRMLVVLAMGMFQYRLFLPASVTYSTRPPLTSTRQCSR